MNLTRLLILILFILIAGLLVEWNQIYLRLLLLTPHTNPEQRVQVQPKTSIDEKWFEINLHSSNLAAIQKPSTITLVKEHEAPLVDFRYKTTRYEPVSPGLGFVNETLEQFSLRHKEWMAASKEVLRSLEANQNVRYSPYGLQQIPGLPFMVRTAIVLSETTIIIVPVDAPRQLINYTFSDNFFLNGSCQVGSSQQQCHCVLETCRCLTHSRNPLKGNTQIPKIICRLEQPINMSDAESIILLGPPETNKNRIRVEFPIEPLPKKTTDLHICYQQFPYSIFWRDKIPVELVEYNIAHHHRLGAKQFHLFSKTVEWTRSIASLKVPKKATVWIHDYPIPPTYELYVNEQNAFQQIMANECLTRAHAMGARYLAIADFDEFIFPYNNQTTSLVKEFDSYPQNKSVFWMYSYEYHPKICAVDRKGNPPSGAKNFLDHMILPLDPATASKEFHPEHLHGSFRTKAIIRIETIGVELLSKLLWLIHNVIHGDAWKLKKHKLGPPYVAIPLSIEVPGPSPKAYIRHFRRVWLPGKCTELYEEGKPIPRGAQMMNRPPAILKTIEIPNIMQKY